MAKAKPDWSVLRGALGVFVACVIVSIALLAASFYFRDAMQKDDRRHHNRFISISSRYLAVDEEERIIRTQYPRFIELYNRGVIGAEDRLSWLESLRQASADARVDALRYRLDSREIFDPDFDVNTRGFEIYTSIMSLDLEMLHEGDFADLLRSLEYRASGLFTVRRCELFLSQPEVTTDSLRSNVGGRCKIDWLTLNRSGDEGIVL